MVSFRLYFGMFSIIKIIRTKFVTLCHVHDVYSKQNIFAMFCCLLETKPKVIIIYVHVVWMWGAFLFNYFNKYSKSWRCLIHYTNTFTGFGLWISQVEQKINSCKFQGACMKTDQFGLQLVKSYIIYQLAVRLCLVGVRLILLCCTWLMKRMSIVRLDRWTNSVLLLCVHYLSHFLINLFTNHPPLAFDHVLSITWSEFIFFNLEFWHHNIYIVPNY
jgi:hypothetical protein